MMTRPKLRIGARGSPLALAQAKLVETRLAAARPWLAAPGALEIVAIRTTGDRILDRPLMEIGGKGLFTKEIDDALLEGRIDLAVHSVKDLPTAMPPGIVLPCMLSREDPRDAFLCSGAPSFAELRPGSLVGTSSLRRQAQIRARHPHLQVVSLRGNLQTRLLRLSEGAVDATLLAAAGLNRLGLAHHATAILSEEDMLPAAGQGAVGATCREDDEEVCTLLTQLNDETTMTCVSCERAFLATLDGSCRTPIAALAVRTDECAAPWLRLRGLSALSDGQTLIRVEMEGSATEAEALGRRAGLDLLARKARFSPSAAGSKEPTS